MTFTLSAQPREKKAQQLREQGMIPAVVYGPNIDSFSVAVAQGEFEKLYNEAGESSLIQLNVEGKEPITVLIHDLQFHPINRMPTHVDFRAITMGEEIDVAIELTFTGVAPAEKELGGTVVKNMDMIDVRCQPSDLIDHLEVDLSVLKTFDDAITVGDLNLPKGLTPLVDEDVVVVKVSAPMSEEELAAMEAEGPASIEDIQVEEKGKKEEEESEK